MREPRESEGRRWCEKEGEVYGPKSMDSSRDRGEGKGVLERGGEDVRRARAAVKVA